MKATPQTMGRRPIVWPRPFGEFFLALYIGIHMAKFTCFLSSLSGCCSVSTVKDQPFCVHNYALETTSNGP